MTAFKMDKTAEFNRLKTEGMGHMLADDLKMVIFRNFIV